MKIFLTIFTILSFLIMTLALPKEVEAKTSASSAALITPMELKQQKEDNRAKILQRFLESYDSPIAPYAQVFIDQADKNNIDWKLLPAITGVESYFGKHIPAYSFNGWGYGVYGTNVRRFNSWEDGIAVVSKALRDDYMNKWKAENVTEIGRIYAADPQWAYKVQHFIDLIEQFEGKSSNKTLSLSL